MPERRGRVRIKAYPILMLSSLINWTVLSIANPLAHSRGLTYHAARHGSGTEDGQNGAMVYLFTPPAGKFHAPRATE